MTAGQAALLLTANLVLPARRIPPTAPSVLRGRIHDGRLGDAHGSWSAELGQSGGGQWLSLESPLCLQLGPAAVNTAPKGF